MLDQIQRTLHLHSNETEDPTKNKSNNNSTHTTTGSRHPSHHNKNQQSSTKKIEQYWKLTANPQKEISLEEGN